MDPSPKDVDRPPSLLKTVNPDEAARVTGEVLLPDEALFNIFSKLASQDPPTLLAASSTCKNFYSVVCSHNCLWRSAFYSPSEPPHPQEPEVEAFQEIVQRFDGFEALVRARWARTISQRKALNDNRSASFEESLKIIESRSEIIVLVLVRTLEGRLCLYGAGQASREVKSVMNIGGSSGSYLDTHIGHLRPLVSVKDLPVDVTKVSWADVDVQLETYILFIGGSVKWAPLYRAKAQYDDIRAMKFDSITGVCWHISSEPGMEEVRKGSVQMCLYATLEDAQYNERWGRSLSRGPSVASVKQRHLGAFVDWGVRFRGYCGRWDSLYCSTSEADGTKHCAMKFRETCCRVCGRPLGELRR